MCEPKEIHLVAVKHIMRYLQGTLNLGLKYEKVDLGTQTQIGLEVLPIGKALQDVVSV